MNRNVRIDILVMFGVAGAALLSFPWVLPGACGNRARLIVSGAVVTIGLLTEAFQKREGRGVTKDTGFLSALMTAGCVVGIGYAGGSGLLVFHSTAAFVAGAAIFTGAVCLRLLARRTLAQSFTYAIQVSPGQRLVTRGIYGVVRHPAYAGTLLAIVSLGLLYQTAVGFAAALGGAVVTIGKIRREERLLTAYFGREYEEYAGRTNALVPLVW